MSQIEPLKYKIARKEESLKKLKEYINEPTLKIKKMVICLNNDIR